MLNGRLAFAGCARHTIPRSLEMITGGRLRMFAMLACAFPSLAAAQIVQTVLR